MDSNSYIQPRRSNKLVWIVLLLLLILIVAAGCVFMMKKYHGGSINATSEYQSVFLANGQVYFGKLAEQGRWLVLTDVYYLQVTQPLQSASGAGATPTTTGTDTANNTEIKLVKLGSELHGPEDAMYIDRNQVLFWENMKDNSKVLEAIKTQK